MHNIPSRLRSQNKGNGTKIILQGKGRSSSIFQYFVYEQQGFDGPNAGTKYLQKNYSYLSVEIRQNIGLAEKLRTLSSTYLKEQFHEIFDPFCGQNPIGTVYIGTVSAKLLTARKHIYVNTEPVSFKNRKVP